MDPPTTLPPTTPPKVPATLVVDVQVGGGVGTTGSRCGVVHNDVSESSVTKH